MLDAIKDFFSSKEKEKTKNVAKQRLQFVLVQDRIQISPKEMEKLKKDLLEVLNKYIAIDKTEIDMELNRNEDMMALLANFPVNYKKGNKD